MISIHSQSKNCKKSVESSTHHVLPTGIYVLVVTLKSGLSVESYHQIFVEEGVEFYCVHNHDNSDLMNGNKFERFILEKTKAIEPFHWELPDKSGMKVITKAVENKDQGPLKEWGPFGWYHHSTMSDIKKASGKTVYLTQMICKIPVSSVESQSNCIRI